MILEDGTSFTTNNNDGYSMTSVKTFESHCCNTCDFVVADDSLASWDISLLYH